MLMTNNDSWISVVVLPENVESKLEKK